MKRYSEMITATDILKLLIRSAKQFVALAEKLLADNHPGCQPEEEKK